MRWMKIRVRGASKCFRFAIDHDLELRLIEERHAEELFALVDRNREHLREWLVWVDRVGTVDAQKRRINESLEGFADGEGVPAGIWFQGDLAGEISFTQINRAHRSAYIEYWLSADRQGNGLVTRSCRAMLDHAFDELGLNRVELDAAPGNVKSRAIAERLGFRQEGILREVGWRRDHYGDLVVYAMLAREWRELRRTARPH